MKNLLKKGLIKINNLKESLDDIEVVINDHNNQDLVNFLIWKLHY